MATFSKQPLSGCANGIPILVTGTATGTSVTVHTAQAGTGGWDEVWIWACNNHTSDVQLTIEYGGGTTVGYQKISTVTSKTGEVLVIPGFILQNGLTVKAFAVTGSVIALTGFVNRIS